MQATFPAHGATRVPLRRPHQGRMIAGVAAGLAEHFDVDVAVVRVGLVVLTLVGALGVPLYLAAWLFVPDECDDESVAERLLGYGCSGQAGGPGSYASATAMASAPARAGAPRDVQAEPAPPPPPAPHAGAEPDARRSHDAAPS